MRFFRRPQPRVSVAQLLASAQSELARGVPRQTICQGWLSQDRCSLTPEERVIYGQAERQLFAEMIARNQRGAELEKCGKIPEAIAEYEANVADRFLGAQPYQRLQALYLAQGDYDKALRTSRLHTSVLAAARQPSPTVWDDHEDFDVDAVALPLTARLRLADT
jgi:tetratricopeptide (TPR) repeat protein